MRNQESEIAVLRGGFRIAVIHLLLLINQTYSRISFVLEADTVISHFNSRVNDLLISGIGFRDERGAADETAIGTARLGLADRIGAAGEVPRGGVPDSADGDARRYGYGLFFMCLRAFSAGIRAVRHGDEYGCLRGDGAGTRKA